MSDLHAVNIALQDSGFGPQLLCSLVTFHDAELRPLALVYFYKRGTFYPFAPLPGQKRDNPLELQVKATVKDDLRVEEDLNRWFPLWGAPGLLACGHLLTGAPGPRSGGLKPTRTPKAVPGGRCGGSLGWLLYQWALGEAVATAPAVRAGAPSSGPAPTYAQVQALVDGVRRHVPVSLSRSGA